MSAALFGWIGEFENAIPYSGSKGQLQTLPAFLIIPPRSPKRKGRDTHIENHNTVQAVRTL